MIKKLKKLPVGISDFKELIENNYYFVDKTYFIKEIINADAKVLLLPRPRRFGKTINLSMLRFFFEKTIPLRPGGFAGQDGGQAGGYGGQAISNKQLFRGLKIEKCQECMSYQEQYPVIFFTLKDIKETNWESTFNKIKDLIGQEFKRHKYLLDSNILDSNDKNIFKNIISRKAEQFDYENSLKKLTEYLTKFHNKKPIILIDEYDSPINAGFINNYYIQIINFMRGFLGAGLKDNPNLEKAVITGILRVARESIFSGLNNLAVYSILKEDFSEFFGFEQSEVEKLLKDYNLENKIDEVKKWYDGYNFGNHKIYNPWSILNFISNKAEFSVYWVNTSDNQLIRDLISRGDEELKTILENIIAGASIEYNIDENIVFPDIYKINSAVFSLLLFSGYLTATKVRKNYDNPVKLSMPNQEIKILYEKIIIYWFENSINFSKYKFMLENLLSGNIEEFKEYFINFVTSSFSSFDLPENESEKIYHAFVLGILVTLSKDYIVKSNRESGFGRYDVMLIPNDKNKLGLVIEFKKAEQKETIDNAVTAAIKQIEEKKYTQELKDLGIKNILSLGIAFKGKEVKILKK
ncbi:ATP-binding protein [Candidatus Babeliales bacterium]|nr:ATP-binding protein [Candidatus Babeliales bacterium]MCF7899737.1 ATP-binding protein [Candidatus Babeliales bacterium]